MVSFSVEFVQIVVYLRWCHAENDSVDETVDVAPMSTDHAHKRVQLRSQLAFHSEVCWDRNIIVPEVRCQEHRCGEPEVAKWRQGSPVWKQHTSSPPMVKRQLFARSGSP